MEKRQKNPNVFSQSGLQRFIASNLEKIIFIFMLFIIVTFLTYKETLNINGLVLALAFLSGLIYAFVRVQRQFAYKIVVDFNSQKLQLHMHRSNVIISEDFSAIQKIRVNGYIIFKFDNRKIYYNDLQNGSLLECINNIKRIEWGGLCAIWGPSKTIRDKIS